MKSHWQFSAFFLLKLNQISKETNSLWSPERAQLGTLDTQQVRTFQLALDWAFLLRRLSLAKATQRSFKVCFSGSVLSYSLLLSVGQRLGLPPCSGCAQRNPRAPAPGPRPPSALFEVGSKRQKAILPPGGAGVSALLPAAPSLSKWSQGRAEMLKGWC